MEHDEEEANEPRTITEGDINMFFDMRPPRTPENSVAAGGLGTITRLQARAEAMGRAEEREPDFESDTQTVIREVCDEFRDWLIAKNKQYGDSAIHPVRVFSSSSDEEQLLVRIDDKLSRLYRGNAAIEPDADIMDDLLGYWLLLKVLRRKAGA